MSDFGAIIRITKKDHQAFSEEDIEKIVEVSNQIKASSTLRCSLSEPYLFEVGRTKGIGTNDCYEVNILLSNYWGNISYFKWHKIRDQKNLKPISNSIGTLLSKNYKLSAKFEWW